MMTMEEPYIIDIRSDIENRSINTTDATSNRSVHFKTVIEIEVVSLPVICLLGLIGNTLSTVTFLRKPLRRSPCSLYLAARGISDNGFLLSLLMVWISSTFGLQLSQVRGICQVIIFMTYMCGCVSVWLCVFVSFENFFMIYNPFLSRRICTDKTSKIVIVILIILAVSCYQTSFWIMNSDCSHNADYSTMTQFMVYSDTLFTLVVPTMLIALLLCMITYKLVNIVQRKNLNKPKHGLLSNSVQLTLKTPLPISKVTKMLFIVSLTFFFLNVPSHVIRICLLTGTFAKGRAEATTTEAIIQTIFQLIYYLSFSVNIIVYMLFGSNFRRTFRSTFCCKTTHSRTQNLPKEAVNLVRRNSYHGKMEDHAQNLLVPIDNRRCHSGVF